MHLVRAFLAYGLCRCHMQLQSVALRYTGLCWVATVIAAGRVVKLQPRRGMVNQTIRSLSDPIRPPTKTSTYLRGLKMWRRATC